MESTITYEDFEKFTYETLAAIKSICSEDGPWSLAPDKEKIEAIRKALSEREAMRKRVKP